MPETNFILCDLPVSLSPYRRLIHVYNRTPILPFQFSPYTHTHTHAYAYAHAYDRAARLTFYFPEEIRAQPRQKKSYCAARDLAMSTAVNACFTSWHTSRKNIHSCPRVHSERNITPHFQHSGLLMLMTLHLRLAPRHCFSCRKNTDYFSTGCFVAVNILSCICSWKLKFTVCMRAYPPSV